MSEPFVPNTFQKTTSKLASQDWSLDEVTLEGWCQKEKGTDEFMLDTSDVSQLSEDYWNDESKPSVFKNALVNLSEGLAAMHRRDILNSVSSNRKNAAHKTKNFNIKSSSNLASKKRLHSGNSKRSLKDTHDKDEENLAGIAQQSEPNLPERKTETIIESLGHSAVLQDIKNQEDDSKIIGDSTPNANTSMKQENKSLTEQSEDLKDIHHSENVLKSAKASAYGSEIGSSSQLEVDFESDKLSAGAHKKYSVLIKKSTLPISQRSVRQIQKDDLRVNKSLLQTKQISSPQEAVHVAEVNKPIKRDSIPLMPLPQNPKNVAFIKELQIRNPQLKIDGIGQNRAKQMKENELTENLNLRKRTSEPLEVRNNNTSLRTVFGQAFKDAEAPPLFTMNLKGTSIGKQKEAAKENIKESVDYILGLYKSGADKAKTTEVNPTRDSFKVTENLKRTSYHPKAQPLKEKLINQEDVTNRTSSRSQGRADVAAFRVKKIGNDFDDKKFLPGTIKMNEIVFQ